MGKFWKINNIRKSFCSVTFCGFVFFHRQAQTSCHLMFKIVFIISLIWYNYKRMFNWTLSTVQEGQVKKKAKAKKH